MLLNLNQAQRGIIEIITNKVRKIYSSSVFQMSTQVVDYQVGIIGAIFDVYIKLLQQKYPS